MRTVTGLSMGLINRVDPASIATLRTELWALLAAGRIHPAIAAELPLTQAGTAYELLAARTNLGKIALIP
jgi:NADPH:quinone reductase-like Zn-dependent oxidoreductase